MSAVSERFADAPGGGFRVALGLYLALFVTGATAAGAATQSVSTTVLVAVSGGGLAAGAILAAAAVQFDDDLAVRLGRSRRRRALLLVPGIPGLLGGAAAVVSWSTTAPVVVAVGASLALLVLGSVLGGFARTEYVETITTGEPIDTWAWTPPNAGSADALLTALWLFLALGQAVGGNWIGAVVWSLIAVGWIVAGVVEGRWQTRWGADPEIRVYEAGLVKRRPFTKTFVPWTEVSHVRLHEDELVLDRGLFDVRLERSELADLETVRERIERTIETAGASARSVR